MEARKPVTVALTVLAYIVTTFAVQGSSHFAINAEYYAGIAIMRTEPVVAMGLLAMVIQGALFALLFPSFYRGSNPVRSGILFSWALGGFIASYVVLGEAGKYTIPSIPSWIAVETGAALVQYTVFGALLGMIHRRSALAAAAPQRA